MIRGLHDAVHEYRQAESAGDADAMAAAREQSDRLLKEPLFQLLAAVVEPPQRDRLTEVVEKGEAPTSKSSSRKTLNA